MKVSFGRKRAPAAASDDAMELATLRYKAAFEEYQGAVERNAEQNLDGGKLSRRALLEEERAFQELDGARYALLNAAALADPTLH